MNKIEVRNVVKTYGGKSKALDSVSFAIGEGELLSLLGPSGCGKTTLLRSIAGFEDIDQGSIVLDGEVITDPKNNIFVRPEKRNLGLVFQNYALWPHMTVFENLDYALETKGFKRHEIHKRVEETLQLVGLAGLENRYPSQLSGGQQQRVALARSLCYEPRVLLLDEPLSNLDLRVREKTRDELRALLKRIGITSIYVTHDQEEAFIMSDRILVMNKGTIIQEGSPLQLYEQPSNTFVADFIGRTNMFEAQITSYNEKQGLAKIRIPDLNAELTCEHLGPVLEGDATYVAAIRCNEIGFINSPLHVDSDNVIKGEVIMREYRGAVTDHKIRVGNAILIVTTHKFCALANKGEEKTVWIHIPPGALKLVRSSK